MQCYQLAKIIKPVILLQVFLAVVIIGVSFDPGMIARQVMSIRMPRISLPDYQVNQKLAEKMFSEVNVSLGGIESSMYVDGKYMEKQIAENMFTTSINALAYSKNYEMNTTIENEAGKYELPAVKRLEDQAVPVAVNLHALRGSKVVFYCTHSAETYIPDSNEARLDGSRGLVTQVAQTMAGTAASKGLSGEYIDTIHDWPEYAKSYTESRKTVTTILEKDKNIAALFDVHRDSIPGMDTAPTVSVQGREAACILIVVGTDQRKDHPRWRENLRFAQMLYQQGQKMYPGLIRGVMTKAGTYNQEYHDHALLLEMGRDYNTFDQAKYAGELFIDVLLKTLEEEVK